MSWRGSGPLSAARGTGDRLPPRTGTAAAFSPPARAAPGGYSAIRVRWVQRNTPDPSRSKCS